MNLYKKISYRLLTLMAVYFALLCFSKLLGFDKVYLKHFVHKGNILFSTFGDGGEVEFFKEVNQKIPNSCGIQLTSKQQKKAAIAKANKTGKSKMIYHPTKITINTWNHFGVLLLFFIACMFVLPISWKRKFLVFLIGYILVEIYFYIKVWIMINLEFSKWYDKFKVGWQNDFLVDTLNYFYIIISYPFFGLLLIFFTIIFLSKRFISGIEA